MTLYWTSVSGSNVTKPWAKPAGTNIWFHSSAESSTPTHWPKVGEPRANVDRDVEDRAARNANQLVLGRGRRLEMQTAQHPGVDAEKE